MLAGLPVEPRPQAWEQDQTDAAIREGKEGEGLNVWETTGISKVSYTSFICISPWHFMKTNRFPACTHVFTIIIRLLFFY